LIELIVTELDRGLQPGHAALVRLHSPDGVADHFSGVVIQARRNLALDETFHLRGKIDVHGHGLLLLAMDIHEGRE